MIGDIDLRVKDAVDKMIDSKRLPHAIMIEGGTDAERINLSKYIIAAKNCQGENKPCFNCNQCHLTETNQNPDVIFVAPEKDKKFISVAKIRQLRADAFVKSHSDVTKFFVLENAELINEQGQNALLKVLEEPPKDVVIILLTPSRTLQLETIISRCTVLRLKTSEDIKGSDETAEDAKEILNNLFDGEDYNSLLLLKKYEKDRVKAERLLRELQNACVLELSKKSISLYRSKILNNIYNECDTFIEMLRLNINTSLLFSSAICRMKSFL